MAINLQVQTVKSNNLDTNKNVNTLGVLTLTEKDIHFGTGTKAYINNPLTSPLTYEENEMLLVSNSETKTMSRTTNIPTNLLGGEIISGGNTTFSASAGTYRGNSAGGVEIVSKWNLYGILPFGKQNIGELIFTGAGKYNRYTVIDYKYYFKDYTGSTNQ